MTRCPACDAKDALRLISAPSPEYVQECGSCGSAFFSFDDQRQVSHADQYGDAKDYGEYLEAQNTSTLAQRHEETLSVLEGLLGDGHRDVFDIGAGAGEFLVRAKQRGFAVSGNDISIPAIAAAKAHGIELVHGDDLAGIARNSRYGAVTMWCVIAHVDSPDELLQGITGLLRPGGVLFFHTPRRCLIDTVALGLKRGTRNRYRSMFDRRINAAHRRQYSTVGVELLLRRHGFEPISIKPVVAYGLRFEAYLVAIGFSDRSARFLGKRLEWLGSRGALPRNTLNVYANRRI